MPQTASVLLNRLLARGKFRHIQVLLKLAELGSLQHTADAVGLTQPSVTQVLASLEALLQIQLFQRHARGVRPTAACLDLLPVARQLLSGMAEGAELVVARQGDAVGVVRVLASASAMNGFLMERLPGFCRAFPRVHVHTFEAEGSDLLLAIARGEVDVAVCRRPGVIPSGWRFDPLVDDRLAVICAPHHRLARRRRLAWTDLGQETWLLAPAGSLAREVFDALSARFAGPVRIYPIVTRGLTLTQHLLNEERLLGFVPYRFVRHLLERGELVELPLTDPTPVPPMGTLAAQAETREAAQAFAAFLQREP